MWCLLCITHYLQSVSPKSLSAFLSLANIYRDEVQWTMGTLSSFKKRPGQISNIMSSLWGRSLRPVPAMLPSSSSLSPGQCPWRDKTTWGDSYQEKLKLKRQLGPAPVSPAISKKAAQLIAASHITFAFFMGPFTLFLYIFCQFPQI